MKDGCIPLYVLKDILNQLPTHDEQGNALMIRISALFSKFGMPHYVSELKLLEINNVIELLLVPDSIELDLEQKENESSLIALVLRYCVLENECNDIDDLDFEKQRALLNQMYQTAVAAKKLNKLI